MRDDFYLQSDQFWLNFVSFEKMNIAPTESKGDCQRCGEHIAFPSALQGEKVNCPHCGGETTLIAESVSDVKEQPPFMFDPAWYDKLPPGAIRALGKSVKTSMELIGGLIGLAGLCVVLVVLLRLLHAAWGS